MLNDVYRCLRKYANDWDEIGRALNVDHSYRSSLRSQGLATEDKCKLESVLDKWLESQCSEVSWDNLIKVLREFDLSAAADIVEAYLLKDGSKYNWTSKFIYSCLLKKKFYKAY